jgi:hypothetical protein
MKRIRLSRNQYMRALTLADLGITESPHDEQQQASLNPAEAYAGVAYLYRAIHLRAGAVARVPFALRRSGRGPREVKKDTTLYRQVQAVLRDALFLVEADLCMFGAAYWRIETNGVGRNATIRRYLPSTITPQWDAMGNVVSFKRRINGKEMSVPAEEMVWWWEPNFTAETGPGPGPVQVALRNAGVLFNLDLFADTYFSRGAVKQTAFFVGGQGVGGMPQVVPPEEAKKIEHWWSRTVRGVASSWRAMVMRYGIQPFQFGTDPKDIAAPELTEINERHIAVAFGIPVSLLNSQASTYASAAVDDFHFYDKLIMPRYASLMSGIQRFLDFWQVTLEPQPHLLEAYQSYQLEQSKAIAPLVGKLYTLDEAREWAGLPPATPEQREELTSGNRQQQILGYHIEQGVANDNEARASIGLPPRDNAEAEARRKLQSQLSVVKEARAAGFSLVQAIELAGMDIGNLDIAQPQPVAPPEGDDDGDGDQVSADTRALRALFDEIRGYQNGNGVYHDY